LDRASPGRIQVTERFYECLQGQGKFQFEKRGVIDVKGKGDMTVYLLEGSAWAETAKQIFQV
jgi:adenylate cyclase